jgi:Ring finger domain
MPMESEWPAEIQIAHINPGDARRLREQYLQQSRLSQIINIACPTPHECKGDDLCPICLCPLADETISVGHCLHVLHASCLHSWLAKRNTCPICRVSFVEDEVRYSPAQDLLMATTSNALSDAAILEPNPHQAVIPDVSIP